MLTYKTKFAMVRGTMLCSGERKKMTRPHNYYGGSEALTGRVPLLLNVW